MAVNQMNFPITHQNSEPLSHKRQSLGLELAFIDYLDGTGFYGVQMRIYKYFASNWETPRYVLKIISE